MSQPAQQCDNCHKILPQSKMATHFGYCRRNVKKCQQCGQMYDINFQQQHQEQFHKKEKCNYCKKEFPSGQISKHKNICNLKPKFCQYCQQNVPVNEYPPHLKMCQSRTKVCQKCRKDIKNIEYLYHIVKCPGIVQQPKIHTKQRQSIQSNIDRRQYKKQQQLKGGKVYNRQNNDVKGNKKQIPSSRQQYEIKQNNNNYAPISYQHHSIKTNQRKQISGRSNMPVQPPYKNQQINQKQCGIKRQNNKVQIQAPKNKINEKNWQVNMGSKNVQNQKYERIDHNQAKNYYEHKYIINNQKIPNYAIDKQDNYSKYQYPQNANRDQGYKHHIYSNQIPKPTHQHEKYKQAKPTYELKDRNNPIVNSKGIYSNQPQVAKIEDKRPQYNGNPSSQSNNVYSIPINNQKQIQNKYVFEKKVENVQYSRNQKPVKKQQYRQPQNNLNNYYHDAYLQSQDTQLQKAIMMSMGSNNENKSKNAHKNTKPPNSYKNYVDIAKQFGDIDMNQSFYADLQLQQAFEEQIKNNRRR